MMSTLPTATSFTARAIAADDALLPFGGVTFLFSSNPPSSLLATAPGCCGVENGRRERFGVPVDVEVVSPFKSIRTCLTNEDMVRSIVLVIAIVR